MKYVTWIIILVTLFTLTSCQKKSETTLTETPNQQTENTQKQAIKEEQKDPIQQKPQEEQSWKILDAVPKEESTTKEEEQKESPKQKMQEEQSWKSTSAHMQEGTMKKSWVFTAYTPELVGKTEKTVLFFHADWCPSCRAADAGIWSDTIPANLSILKVDYDNSDQLKKKYEILSQHTFVQVDKNGNMLAKWVGWIHVSDIEENLK